MEIVHTLIVGGGEKRTYRNTHGMVATVVRLPGTLTRVYFKGGETADFRTFQDACDAVEERNPFPSVSDYDSVA